MEHYKNLDLKDIVYWCEFDLVWKTEQWKDVVGCCGIYMVSDLGRVKSLSRVVLRHDKYPFNSKEKILNQHINNHSYLVLSLNINKIRKRKHVHKLVSEAFLNHIPCGFEKVINHKDFCKLNNKLNNLEITTARINSNKAHLPSTSKYVGVCWEK